VALFHVVGATPEAPTLDAACQGDMPRERIAVDAAMIRAARDALSTATGASRIDTVAIGSPHLSLEELVALQRLVAGKRLAVPFYACTGRDTWREFEAGGGARVLGESGVIPVVDTCVVVAPIMPARPGGVLMTNSGKFAHYAPGNTGYAAVYGSLEDCVASAATGALMRDETLWQ
jgi:hypothetical protein